MFLILATLIPFTQEKFPLTLRSCCFGLTSSFICRCHVGTCCLAKGTAGEESLGKAAESCTEVVSEKSWAKSQPGLSVTVSDTNRESEA